MDFGTVFFTVAPDAGDFLPYVRCAIAEVMGASIDRMASTASALARSTGLVVKGEFR